ncbi:MAG: class I SAM-dependent methyltransferase [Anaerolineales bacterium]|nr:class I SAM-dependent methyltransferase [Anaerolineales bacterium]
MQLHAPLPPDRTVEQVWNHYQVEKALAARLKAADREGRRAIYATMYTELFAQVPDHPRLTRRSSEALTRAANFIKYQLVKPFLTPETVFVEIGPGDCRFAAEMAGRVRQVIGIDISDQSGQQPQLPANFRLVVYDGYHLELSEVADVVFSDQLVEHLHPDDVQLHFELMRRLLRPGGRYVFRTPHAYDGPHDVSRYFADEPEGFHLKEWTYGELAALLGRLGYTRLEGLFRIKGRYFRLPLAAFTAVEQIARWLPRPARKTLAYWLIREIALAAQK